MTHPDHLADEVFSGLVDGQLSPDELCMAQAHLATCLACQARLDEMRALVGLLRALPSVEPPGDFRIGPRLVADPPNVVRLRRWYAWTRAGAGALAAAFVFLSVGTLYVDSRPVANSPAALASKAQPAPAQAPAAQSAPETVSRDAAPTAPAARAAAPALAPAPPAAAGAAVRSQAAPAPTSTEPGDQIAAATTVRPLPTQVPTAVLGAQPPVAIVSLPVTLQPQTDPAAPLRVAAALVGILAAFGILLALLIRHRLRAASPFHLE